MFHLWICVVDTTVFRVHAYGLSSVNERGRLIILVGYVSEFARATARDEKGRCEKLGPQRGGALVLFGGATPSLKERQEIGLESDDERMPS